MSSVILLDVNENNHVFNFEVNDVKMSVYHD